MDAGPRRPPPTDRPNPAASPVLPWLRQQGSRCREKMRLFLASATFRGLPRPVKPLAVESRVP